MKKTLLLFLSFSFWLHAERNGFYLGLNFAEGSYIKGQGSIGEKASAENALNQEVEMLHTLRLTEFLGDLPRTFIVGLVPFVIGSETTFNGAFWR